MSRTRWLANAAGSCASCANSSVESESPGAFEAREIGQIGAIEEAGELASELSQVGMLGGMGEDVPGRQVVEGPVAERGRHLGECFVQGLDLAVDEHARVDRHPLGGGKLGRADEALQRPPRAAQQVPEEPLGLREVHGNASASTARALSLSSTTRSSSGMWSSHSTNAGVRPKRRRAER